MASSILTPVIYELHNLNTQSALSSLNSSSRTGLNSIRRDAQSSQTSLPLPHVVPTPAVATQQQPLYNVLPTGRKVMILITASFMTLAATFSSTSLFPAAPEIAAEFGTSSERITLSNAAVLVAMGFASLIWTPISSVLGRRSTYLLAILIFLVFSLGAAVAKDLTTFMAMRTLAGFEASFFMVAGQALIADIFVPAQRGTAVGFFLSGTVTGPALGPCVGGIIVTFASWRIIFWLQACMAGAALISAFFVVPSIPVARTELPTGSKIRHLFLQLNPMRVFRLWIYPNILLTDLACGALSWNMYSLLAAPRTLINPRFHLTSPLVSGLFYLAPGAGFLVGTTLGGKWADVTVRRHITKRGGLRVAQDRLNSGILAFFTLLPIATLVYGWSLEFIVGGLPLPTVSIFFCGLGLMLGFSSLNTYCTEVMPAKRMEVMAGKYMIQYICSAAGSAAVLPLINTIGVGWACTMSAILVFVAGCLVLVCAKFGESMQRSVDDWLKPSGDRE